jgi:HemY protein
MRSVIWLVVLFVAAVVAATTLGRNDGLVSLYWSGWRLDVSLNLFVIALVLTCLALLLTMRALQSLASLPTRAHEWRVQRRERAAQAALRDALAEYFGARYSRARKSAARAVAIHDATPELVGDMQTRWLAHLLWGASMHRLQDRAQRDRQLEQLRRLRRLGGATQRGSDDGV